MGLLIINKEICAAIEAAHLIFSKQIFLIIGFP